MEGAKGKSNAHGDGKGAGKVNMEQLKFSFWLKEKGLHKCVGFKKKY